MWRRTAGRFRPTRHDAEGHASPAELVGTAANGAEVVALVGDAHPEVVLMDLRMPGMDGVESTRRLRAEHPDVRVVVLTTYADDESVFAALRAGARGYLTKDAGSEVIARAITRVVAGDAMLDPGILARLLDRLDAAPEPGSRTTAPGSDSAGAGRFVDVLTAREVDVLTLIAQGLSIGEIAQRLVVGESTVKTHVNRIFAKPGVRDRAQVVAYAYRTGLVQPCRRRLPRGPPSPRPRSPGRRRKSYRNPSCGRSLPRTTEFHSNDDS